MPYPRLTKIIINHHMKQHKYLINYNHQHYHTIKDDGIMSRLKFVRIGKDYLEYRLPIPETMLTEAIKQFESYKIFINYSTGQIRPKKSRGKGSQGNKTADDSQEIVDVFKESEPEPKPLAMSISQTKAKEVEAARKVHATHARIVTESIPESAKKKSGGRSSKSVVIQDILSAPKAKPATSKTKLKGAPSLTLQEQEAADIMQALKESKKSSRRQPGVPDESTIVSATSSEGTGAKPGVPDEDKDTTEEKVILEWGDEQDSEFFDDDNDDVEKVDKDDDADDEGDDHVSDTQDADDEDVKTESDEDEIYKYKIRVRNEEDVEMKDAEVEESDKGEEKVTDAAKEEAEKTLEAKDDTKKSKLPPSSSSLSVSSSFGDKFLKLSFDSSLVSTVKDSADADVKTTNLPPIPKIVTETPVSTAIPSPQVTPIFSPVQQTPTPTPISTPPITIDAPTVTTAVPESNALTTVELRVAKLEKDVSELKTIDLSFEALIVLQSQVPIVVDSYLDTKVGDVFQKELQKHTENLIHKYSLQHLPELTKKPTPTAEQESEKSPSDILKIKKEQAKSQKKFTIKSTDKADLEEYDLKKCSLPIYACKQGVAKIVKNHKRKHNDDEDDDDEDPPARLNQGKKTKRRRTKESESLKKPSTTKETPKGKALTKGSKTGKSAPKKEP
ncbi:hypothetical protein Tco_1148824, partial [Tanacetum coccineum]